MCGKLIFDTSYPVACRVRAGVMMAPAMRPMAVRLLPPGETLAAAGLSARRRCMHCREGRSSGCAISFAA
jgi:hypothetical protein